MKIIYEYMVSYCVTHIGLHDQYYQLCVQSDIIQAQCSGILVYRLIQFCMCSPRLVFSKRYWCGSSSSTSSVHHHLSSVSLWIFSCNVLNIESEHAFNNSYAHFWSPINLYFVVHYVLAHEFTGNGEISNHHDIFIAKLLFCSTTCRGSRVYRQLGRSVTITICSSANLSFVVQHVVDHVFTENWEGQ